MGIKSYFRNRLIEAVRYAVREEMSTYKNDTPQPQVQINVNQEKDTLQKLDKSVERWTWERYKRIENNIVPKLDKRVEHWTWERYRRIENNIVPKLDKRVEHWTWERFGRMVKQLNIMSCEMAFHKNKIPYLPGEKIRIAILYQIPSCWPSIESVYESLIEDERFEVTMLLYDREQNEAAQMKGAREFLVEKGISFKEAEYFDFRMERPHILLYQTPWDDVHRPGFLRSDTISALGIRVAYVPYGLNYSMSVYPDFIFSDVKFRAKPWLMFCLSEELRVDHQMMSKNYGHNIAVTGVPKFDGLYHKERFKLSEEWKYKIGKRKVIFLQMHFADKGGNPYMPVPPIEEYLQFLRRHTNDAEYFLLLRPHPKYFENYRQLGCEQEAEEMRQLIDESDNMALYDLPDYRPALYAADCVIGDRSALMIEAGVLRVPIMYLTNFYYQEQLLPSIRPLFDSYYQGNTYHDMEWFLDMVMEKGFDYKKVEREEAAVKAIPYFDGLCGKRIVDTMAKVISIEG